MAICITGVAGFIGCNLAERFLAHGHKLVGLDNFSRGSLANLAKASASPLFLMEDVDLSDLSAYRAAIARMSARAPISEVWHMAANSDIPAGVKTNSVDLRDTFMTTFNTLEVMKEFDIPILAFASSSAIYGDLKGAPMYEDTGPLFPVSNYGAMKLASEAAISAALESWMERAFVFRFPNVVGTPATHGALLDFVRRLKTKSDTLKVLGNGTQQKSYLHVDELIDAMLFIRDHAEDRLNYFNIGAEDAGVTVKFMAEEVVANVAPGARISYGEGDKGWVGDVPRFVYSLDKLRALGWHPKLSSAEAVRLAVRQIAAQEVDR